MSQVTGHIQQHTAGLDPVAALTWIAETFPGEVVFFNQFWLGRSSDHTYDFHQ